MTFKVTLMSLNFELYKSSSRMTKVSSLQENSNTNILVLKSDHSLHTFLKSHAA